MRHVTSLVLLLASCATPYAQVKTAKTIEQARELLNGYEPSVTRYSASVEAWYFGRNECVLFVDGQLRLSRDMHQFINDAEARLPQSVALHAVTAD